MNNVSIIHFRKLEKKNRPGEHGYDYKMNSMHALFMAHGPSLKRGLTVEPFENIEIYNLIAGKLYFLLFSRNPSILSFSDLLELEYRAPNNGTLGSLRNVLKKPLPLPPTPEAKQLDRCFSSSQKWSSCGSCPNGV